MKQILLMLLLILFAVHPASAGIIAYEYRGILEPENPEDQALDPTGVSAALNGAHLTARMFLDTDSTPVDIEGDPSSLKRAKYHALGAEIILSGTLGGV